MRHISRARILGIITIIIIVGAIPLTVFLARQQQEIRQRAQGTPWYQCQITDGPEPNYPCGSCSIVAVHPNRTLFKCELDCGGSTSGCPGGTAGNYAINHNWQQCSRKGTSVCVEGSQDLIATGTLGGNGPWTIHGQDEIILREGTFPTPNPYCGRVQVDVQMTADGTDAAGEVLDTGVDCPTFSPTPISPTPVTISPTATTAPQPTPVAPPAPNVTPNCTGTQLTLSWTRNGIIYYYNIKNTTKNSDWIRLSTSNSQITYTAQAGDSYAWAVYACNGSGDNMRCSDTTAGTISCPPAGAPTATPGPGTPTVPPGTYPTPETPTVHFVCDACQALQVPTATPMPTRFATPTTPGGYPYPIPTNTPAPTSTPFPTITLTPTPTPTRTPTPTPTRTPTPTPKKTPTPVSVTIAGGGTPGITYVIITPKPTGPTAKVTGLAATAIPTQFVQGSPVPTLPPTGSVNMPLAIGIGGVVSAILGGLIFLLL